LLEQGGPFHPTFLYELLWNLAVAALVLWADRKFRLGKGRAFALYVAGYTVGRFWIEALRIDEANHFLGMRLNNWVSLLVLAGAVAYLVRVKGPQEHMRIDDDGTVHIVTADGTPIPGYPPVKAGERTGGDDAGTGSWAANARARSSQLWTSVTSRWSGDDEDDKDDRDEGGRSAGGVGGTAGAGSKSRAGGTAGAGNRSGAGSTGGRSVSRGGNKSGNGGKGGAGDKGGAGGNKTPRK
jgi:hypothetical protein